jgi:hypothetical protein
MDDPRIVLHQPGIKKDDIDNEPDAAVELNEDQLALANHCQIDAKDFARLLSASHQHNKEQIQSAAKLLKLIDRILAKHYPDVKCKFLFSYQERSYKMMLKKRNGHEHLEFFTADLIEDLIQDGRVEGLKILEGIIAGAAAKL